MSDIVERLNENIIADAFESHAIVDGALCERLIRERKEAAETIEKLRAALMGIIADMNGTQFPQTNVRAISVGALNAAATALKETGDE